MRCSESPETHHGRGHSSTQAYIGLHKSSSYSHPGWNANTLLLPIDITLAQTRIPSTPLTEKLFYAKPLSQLNTQLNTQAHISYSCRANTQMHKHCVPLRLRPFSESPAQPSSHSCVLRGRTPPKRALHVFKWSYALPTGRRLS